MYWAHMWVFGATAFAVRFYALAGWAGRGLTRGGRDIGGLR
jgi:hypothetical protein